MEDVGVGDAIDACIDGDAKEEGIGKIAYSIVWLVKCCLPSGERIYLPGCDSGNHPSRTQSLDQEDERCDREDIMV